MSVPAEASDSSPDKLPDPSPAAAADRRSDVDGKQARVGALLQEVECDGLLVLEPENFAWLTSGATPWGILDPADLPVLFFSPEQRWLLARNVDSQRLFDEEIDGLGFQLKEWPWHWGRQQLLNELSQGRKLASDLPLNGCKVLGDQLRQRRQTLTPHEMARYRDLGHVVSHALEATCRALAVNQTEQEIAGQVSHRLMHRRVEPVAVEVAADGRSRRYRQGGFTTAPVRRYCVLTATGRQHGLYATASRSMCFGPPDEAFEKEHAAACKITATYIASSWPDGVLKEVLNAGRRIYRVAGFEHEWRLSPPGHITGRSAVERALTPDTTEVLRAGWALTWRASVGAAFSCDTYLVTTEGPKAVTAMGSQWPQKRIRIQGGHLVRPEILQRRAEA
jgi:Xaa-Pro dipeptidase